VRLGYLSPGGEQEERAARRRVQEALVERLHRDGFLPTPVFEEAAVLVAWQSFLAASAAEIMVVNLEDLWLEPRPQNVPGTGPELPNWRRPARHTLETFTMLDEVLDILRQIDALRRKEPIHAP
jgi:4-alpha-glucanotransferase